MRGGGSKKVTVTPAWRKDRKGLTSDPAILVDQLRKMETKLLRSKGKLLELIDRKFGVNWKTKTFNELGTVFRI